MNKVPSAKKRTELCGDCGVDPCRHDVEAKDVEIRSLRRALRAEELRVVRVELEVEHANREAAREIERSALAEGVLKLVAAELGLEVKESKGWTAVVLDAHRTRVRVLRSGRIKLAERIRDECWKISPCVGIRELDVEKVAGG